MIIRHSPVLLKEILSYLPQDADNLRVIDATLGEGGHSESFLKMGAEVLGVDRDETIIAKAKERLDGYAGMHYVNCTYDSIAECAPKHFIAETHAILFDLGVSMYHFKEAQRGFSFKEDSELDMRLSVNAKLSAYEVVNEYSEDELTRIFRDYAQLRYADVLAKRICERREEAPIKSVKELEDVIYHATPSAARRKRIHPATLPFQAIRIEVNDELGILEAALEKSLAILKDGGLLFLISYHSLEDKICKSFIRERSKKFGSGELLTINKKVIKPSASETKRNAAARSAKLRIAKKNGSTNE